MSTKQITTKVVTYDKPGGDPKPPGASLSLGKDEADRMIGRGHAIEATGAGAPAAEPAKKPKGDKLTAALVEAIGGLNKDDEDLWTGSGKPNVNALEAVLGYAVSAAERDGAWDTIKAATRPAPAPPASSEESGKGGDQPGLPGAG